MALPKKHTLSRHAVFSPRASPHVRTITTRCLRECHKPLLTTLAATIAIKTYTMAKLKRFAQTRVMPHPMPTTKRQKTTKLALFQDGCYGIGYALPVERGGNDTSGITCTLTGRIQPRYFGMLQRNGITRYPYRCRCA